MSKLPCYNVRHMSKRLRGIFNFFKKYKQLGFVVISLVVAIALHLAGYRTASNWVLVISALINLGPLVWDMIQDIRSGIYGVDILAATAITSALLFREYWAAMVIVLMLTGGETLEDFANERAKSELSALLSRAPAKAHIIRGRKEIDIPASQVHVGDKLVIRPGEIVPVDAIIIDGAGDFDESSLTGESLPISKKPGDDILSGSINQDALITVKALQTAEDSQYQQIIKLVRAAEANRSPFVRMADRYSVPFTLLSFTIAIGAWALSGDSKRFLEVMVVATPCPLILGAPIAIISGISRAAKHGIIVKTGEALEQLATAKTIGFDKTGTLTTGKPEVGAIKTFATFDLKTVITLAAALEQNSNHVLASAIVDKATKLGAKVPKAKHIEELSGKGLSAHAGGHDVLVGRLSLLQEKSVEFPNGFKKSSINQTAALVAVDGKLAGIINFEDKIRPESANTLAQLKTLGVKHMLMVTGDNKTTAEKIARTLGIDEVTAEALPGDKLVAIENTAYKPVAFVGDGVNDAPVLAASDVGVALGARGSTAASESADIVIMLDSIEQVAVGTRIAKRTLRIAKQAILTGIILSVILMFIFATGRFEPIYGAAIQEVVDVVVIVYALRAHADGRKKSHA